MKDVFLVLGSVVAGLGFLVACVGFLLTARGPSTQTLKQDATMLGSMVFVGGAVVVLLALFLASPANSADLRLRTLPNEVTQGHSFAPIGRFGTYSDAYLKRRWRLMCGTAARYQAMGEAFEFGKPQPCTD